MSQKRLPAYSEALLANFADSGLAEAQLRRMGVTDVAAAGDPNVLLNVPAARIPYFDVHGKPTGFYRLRALADTYDKERRLIRYKQPRDSGNHLYFPPLLSGGWRHVASDPERRVLITEGEKKAACACALGVPTIGLGGVSNWISGGQPISHLDLLTWTGRQVFVVFDSDIRANFQVAMAAEKLAAELRRRGAEVRIATLPEGEGAK